MSRFQNIDPGFLFNMGENFKAYNFLGCHRINDEEFIFRVFAPRAENVLLKGDFSSWNDIQMYKLDSGIWEVKCRANINDLYKYKIVQRDGKVVLKADPFAFYSQVRPNNASVVYELNGYSWTDSKFLKSRRMKKSISNPMNIYEVHLGSWMRHLDGRYYTYRELADRLVRYVKENGYTHIEIMPLMEHPDDMSWGYQITGYYSITSRFGSPEDFMYFVDKCHSEGIYVILDWVPSHFVRDEHGLIYFDGTATFESEDYNKAYNPDWGTMQFDYSKNEVISFLISNADFYINKYHIDGFRLDAVSSMIYLSFGKKIFTPNVNGEDINLEAVDFLRKLNEYIHENYQGVITCAEESTDYKGITHFIADGGLGFDYKWNMGWMNDILRYIELSFKDRYQNQKLANFSFIYTFNENYILPLSHDEVVHGKKSIAMKNPGDDYQNYQGMRALISFMFAHPGKKLNFMTNSIGQRIEWRYYQELEWVGLTHSFHNGMQNLYKDLGMIYKEYPAMYELENKREGLTVLSSQNDELLIKLIRHSKKKKKFVVTVNNFSDKEYISEKIGVPYEGQYRLILNTELKKYGGSWDWAQEFYDTKKGEVDGMNQFIEVNIPALSGVFITAEKLKGDKIK